MALALTFGPLAAPCCLQGTHPTAPLPLSVVLPWLAPTSLVLQLWCSEPTTAKTRQRSCKSCSTTLSLIPSRT